MLTHKVQLLVPGTGFPHAFVYLSSNLALLTEENPVNPQALFCFYQRCLLNSFILDTLNCILQQVLEKFRFKMITPVHTKLLWVAQVEWAMTVQTSHHGVA